VAEILAGMAEEAPIGAPRSPEEAKDRRGARTGG
jgi:hypothetical protein